MSATTEKLIQEIEETKAKCAEQEKLGNKDEATKLRLKIETLSKHLKEANTNLEGSTLLKG